LQNLEWKKTSLFEEILLGEDKKAGLRAKILNISGGKSLPLHRHEGVEYSIVLDGCYIDGDKVYNKGDFMSMTKGSKHAPRVAENQNCVCLIIYDKVTLSGKISKFFNAFVDF
jgi:putative transcriptional regulator